MAVTSFTIEGVTLAYFSGEDQTRHIVVEPDKNVEKADAGPANAVRMSPERLETYIAKQLDFPNQAEFDAIYKRLDELRQQGLRPAADEPDIVRKNVKLRVTVEVL